MRRVRAFGVAPLFVASVLLHACGGDSFIDLGPEAASVYGFANGCYGIEASDPGGAPMVLEQSADGFTFTGLSGAGAAFFMKPSDLGTYLFYDAEGQYLVSDGSQVQRLASLQSDVLLIDDSYQSEAEWELQVSDRDQSRHQLRHMKSGQYIATQGLVADAQQAAAIELFEQTGCAAFPEATLDASGELSQTAFEDGSLFGYVDTHSHILSNFAFGGGGIYHGSAFHRLGIEHALSDCEIYHGEGGTKDLFGFGFDQGSDIETSVLLAAFLSGSTPEFNHATDGYPEFTDWPSAHDSSTHQVQYYKWIQRAYLSGLRLVIQHATSNQVICDLLKGAGVQPTRYECNDMVAIDRIIDETYNMERYIDAQEGGPGEGWFRIVMSPAEARTVINDGKMAVVLGIEVSNLFDCLSIPSADFATCDEATVLNKLDEYHDRGVRAMFPVHKYDNAFSAGDGQKSIIELGNFIQTGHYSNFTTDCPDINTSFDRGTISFPGINMPREEFLSAPPHDLSGFADDPIVTLAPFLLDLMADPVTGDYCQSTGLTQLGEFLIEEMMQRGMIIEVDHLPRRSYQRAFELLTENDYPAAGTHGLNNNGQLYALGGVSKTGFRTCRDESQSGTMDDGFQARVQQIRDNGGFPAEGFGLDLNGFAGARGPRFGDNSGCGGVQADPITYPFDSYAGDITFTEPVVGNRTIDFNTEGMAHVGLLAEVIEDVRNDGATDEDLEPLFKSAEGYIRMWEKAESRAEALRAQ